MRFQILASTVVFLAGFGSAAPTNSTTSAIVFSETYFGGKVVSWPIDGKCHTVTDKAPKLSMVGSVKIVGDVVCHLHASNNCDDGSSIDINFPGAPDLVMILNWAAKTKAILCEKTPAQNN
ncbi:hypothetical protein NQ176_g7919 [Zarea fungicola]|uniref:Uncharacterized protein n=1 Tax=Zarea fungicola TaxID=93591 RepID=A0ACC1MWE2_9HYPO|nr:hypothetical protein NQ176_g7919 [Lecanicillium fungicola]